MVARGLAGARRSRGRQARKAAGGTARVHRHCTVVCCWGAAILSYFCHVVRVDDGLLLVF